MDNQDGFAFLFQGLGSSIMMSSLESIPGRLIQKDDILLDQAAAIRTRWNCPPEAGQSGDPC